MSSAELANAARLAGRYLRVVWLSAALGFCAFLVLMMVPAPPVSSL
jgi:hypothetical protein